jgi:chromosome segregation ATPase
MNISDVSFTGILIKAGWMSVMCVITGLFAWLIVARAKKKIALASKGVKSKESIVAEQFAAKDAEISRLTSQLGDMQACQKVSEEKLAQLKELERAHTAAGSELLAAKSEVEKAKMEMEALKAGASDGAEQLAAKDSEIVRLTFKTLDMQARQEDFEEKLARLKELERTHTATEAELFAARRRLEKAEMELAALKAGVSDGAGRLAAKDAEMARLLSQLADAQARQKAFEARLAQLKESQTAHSATEAELLSIKRKFEKAETEIGALKDKSAAAVEQISSKDNEIVRLTFHLSDMQARQEAYEEKLAQLKELEKTHIATEAELLSAKRKIEKAETELEALKDRSAAATDQLTANDAEMNRLASKMSDMQAAHEISISRLKERLAIMGAQQEISEKKLSRMKTYETDAQQDKAEIGRQKQAASELLDEMEALRAKAATAAEQFAANDAEIKRLTSQLADMQANHESSVNGLKERLAIMAAQQDISEKKLSRMKTYEADAQRDKAEIEKQKQAAGALMDELDALKAGSAAVSEQLAAKDIEIKRLASQLADMQANNEVSGSRLKERLAMMIAQQEFSEKKLSRMKAYESDAQRDKAEIEKQKQIANELLDELNALRAGSDVSDQLAAKDAEIARLAYQLSELLAHKDAYENRLAQFKKIESDMQRLESETEERRKSSQEIKRRVEESMARMRLINDKAKENVELLASLAGEKEFDEFRRSINIDDIILKQDGEIKELRSL